MWVKSPLQLPLLAAAPALRPSHANQTPCARPSLPFPLAPTACRRLAALRTMRNATSGFKEANNGLNENNTDAFLVTSNHRCCAERRLLEEWTLQAKRHGVPSHKIVSWIRRKIGTHIAIIRYRSDGTLGCAVPCIFCQKELLKYDMHIHCPTASGGWFSGRLTDENAPKPVLTAGQRRMFKRDIKRPPGTQTPS